MQQAPPVHDRILTTVISIRSLIEIELPEHDGDFYLHLCLLSSEWIVDNRGIHADFVDARAADDFHDFLDELARMSEYGRCLSTFRLLIAHPSQASPLRNLQFVFQPGDLIEIRAGNLRIHENVCHGTAWLQHLRFMDHLPDLSYEPDEE